MSSTKLSFLCDRKHAEIWEGLLAGLDENAVVGQEAVSIQNGDDLSSGLHVRVVAFLDGVWSRKDVSAIVSLGAALTGQKPDIFLSVLPAEDWAVKSQQGLERLRVKRLMIVNGEDQRHVPIGLLPIRIQAANAFGTGHQGTTFGCLLSIQKLQQRLRRPVAVKQKIADIGCGTALLAFAAAKIIKPDYPVLASDIDPRSIPTAMANAKSNQILPSVKFVVAPDVQHKLYRRASGFDLVFANILSGLLIDMAPRLAQIVKPGGRLVLAGLITDHAISVEKAYRFLGYRLEHKYISGDWPILTLRRIRRSRARRLHRGDQRFHPLKGGKWMHW